MSQDEPFKVGDKVAVYGHFDRLQGFDEIAKITPTGRIRLKGVFAGNIYNPDGIERTSSWSYTRIIHDTPELRQKIAAEQEEKDLRALPHLFSWQPLSIPQLRELKALLDKFKGENQL